MICEEVTWALEHTVRRLPPHMHGLRVPCPPLLVSLYAAKVVSQKRHDNQTVLLCAHRGEALCYFRLLCKSLSRYSVT